MKFIDLTHGFYHPLEQDAPVKFHKPSLKLIAKAYENEWWEYMGILVSLWDGLLQGAMLVSGSVSHCLECIF